DFVISRQRAWGAPIPIVHCEACGPVPVPRSQLPVLLPRDVRPAARGNALAQRADFVQTSCPRCAAPARREADTLDCHFDGLWMWMPMCVPREERGERMFTSRELERWLPGHQLIWGTDGSSYMFDHRVTAKALRDLGDLPWLESGETFLRHLIHGMVQVGEAKMSRSGGNAIDPQRIVGEHGADALRLAVLLPAAPRKPLRWSSEHIDRSCGFLYGLWCFAEPRLRPLEPPRFRDAAIVEDDRLRRRLAQWCRTARQRTTEDLAEMRVHRALDNAMQLVSRIERFETLAIERRSARDSAHQEAVAAALRLALQLLSPFAPHLCDELWVVAGGKELASLRPWPGQETQPEAVASCKS
ncbi:MAG: class I tRNA ligase family protein, partial [Conexibacter sp.]